MATRRRRKVTWLPTLGTVIGEGDGTVAGRNLTIAAPTDGTISTLIFPVAFDEPRDTDTLDTSLVSMADAIGSEYMLHRVVGKVPLCRVPVGGEDPDDEVPVLVGAGFCVARSGDPLQGQPIGSATADDRNNNYSPLELDTAREPWLWRRTWILGRAGALTSSQNPVQNPLTAAFPASNTMMGSMLDGPHIDARTRRRVGNDDRLWFVISVVNFPIDTPSLGQVVVSGLFEVRLVGQILRARNRGNF